MSIRAWVYRLGYPCAKVWWFFRRPRTEGVHAIVRNKDKILLVRQSYRTRKWCLPGGGMMEGESRRDAVMREVREETGLQPITAVLAWSFPWTNEFKRDYVHLFVVQASGEPVPDGDEVIAARWFASDDLPDDLDACAELALNSILSR